MVRKEPIKVAIGDEIYSLVSDELEQHVREAATLVDQSMTEIIKAGVKEKHKAAVLASLHLASSLLKERDVVLNERQTLEKIKEWVKIQHQILSTIV